MDPFVIPISHIVCLTPTVFPVISTIMLLRISSAASPVPTTAIPVPQLLLAPPASQPLLLWVGYVPAITQQTVFTTQ